MKIQFLHRRFNPKKSSHASLTPILLAALGFSFPLPFLPAQAQAQQASRESAQNRGSNRELTPVIVQARRSAEQARDVPFTVQTLDDVALEERRIASLEDLLRGVPGIEVNSWGGADSANVRMRGVGSLYQSGSDDTSVVVNVDGIPTSVGNSALGLLDVEQVEVLKGPQSALFGRSSVAGAINIRTRHPALGRVEGHARTEAGNDRHHLVEGAANLPLGQTAAARFAVRHNARDYDYENLTTGNPVSRPRDLAWRASLLWQPQAATEVMLSANRHDARRYQSVMLMRPYGDRPGQRLNRDGLIDGNRRRIAQYALQLQHDLSWTRLTAASSHERIDSRIINMTGSEINRLMMDLDLDLAQLVRENGKIWNHDLRLSSLPGSRVFWVAGLNHYHSQSDNLQGHIAGHFDHDQNVLANAIYGEATWPLGSAFKLTAGLRYARERKRYNALYAPQGAPTSTDSRSLSDSHTSGRLGLGWALNAYTNLYATYARGAKPGGFNEYATQAADSTPYSASQVDSLELGAKHEAAGGRLQLNAALFFNRVKDDHLLAYNPNTLASQYVNANVRSQGLELDTRWRAGGGLTLNGALTLIDGKIRSSVATPGGQVSPGNRLPDVPRFSALLGVQWQRALPAFWGLRSPTLNARASLRHVGQRPADPQNSFNLDSYNRLDLRLGIVSGNTELYLWADNLTDKRYDLYGYQLMPGLQVGMASHGRNAGLGLMHQF